jgi:DNA-nicking Smr family endonuclease
VPALASALAPGELSALNAAYAGVQPIRRPKRGRRAVGPAVRRVTAAPDPGDQAARERLAALVSGGVRFEIRWDDGWVQGLRQGTEERVLRRLSGAGFEPEATLDLHGMSREQAMRATHEFVRGQQQRGARYLLIIVGKGLHSEGGVGVLAESAAKALTQGLAAPLVTAFASADARHGGRGALAVMLR